LGCHTANSFKADIFIGAGDEEVNAKSILGLLTLAATKGTPVIVRAEGEDEQAATRAIVTLFENRFGEEE
jgi:phosphocarrier protein